MHDARRDRPAECRWSRSCHAVTSAIVATIITVITLVMSYNTINAYSNNSSHIINNMTQH